MTPRLARRSAPPLVQLAAVIAGDFVSSLAFALLYGFTRSLVWSLALALVAGLAGMAWTRSRGRRIEPMQWTSLGLVVVFGAAGLLTHDARVVMFKPTVIYVAVGVAMLKPGWMRRYLPSKAQRHGGGLTDAFGYVWAAAMVALAIANLGLALHGDARLWAAFLGAAPLAVKLGLGGVQYALTRRHVVAALRREHATSALGSTNPIAESDSVARSQRF